MRVLHTLLATAAAVALSSCCWSGVQKHDSTTSGEVEAPAEAAWPAMPEPGPMPAFTPPSAERFTLSNGLPVTLIQAGAVPLLRMQLNVYTGTGDDPAGKAGLADFTADLLNEGTTTRSALELSDGLMTLASGASFGADRDFSYGSLDSLETNFEATLELFADMLKNASFPEEDLARVRTERLNRLLSRHDQIANVAWDVFYRLTYGDNYLGRPGVGTPAEIEAITRDEITAWYASVWRPSNAGVVLVTRLGKEAVLPVLEAHLGTWEDSDAARIEHQPVESTTFLHRTIHWVDRPGSSQSYVIVGNNTTVGFDEAQQAARTLGNHPFGGQFTARINMNLREDKGYTYGARSRVRAAERGGVFATWASVKTATTAASLTEFLTELDGYFGDAPMTDDEFGRSKSTLLQGYAGRFEGVAGVLGQFASADAHRRPEGWVAGYPSRVDSVTRDAAFEALDLLVSPADLAVVIVGDWNAAGADVAALNVGEITFRDASGNLTDPPAPPAE